jgi:hypothetical protein
MSEIAELFARDPLKLTREDRTKIIAHFRENREKYIAGVKAPKAVAEKKTKAPVQGKLSLDDLGL